MEDEKTFPKPLGLERKGYGEGFSEEEALGNWLDTDDQFLFKGGYEGRFGRQAIEYNKIQAKCVRQPYIPQRCTVDILKQAGARSWDTKHVVYNEDNEVIAIRDTKAEAIQAARQHTLEYGVDLYIKVEKHLTGGNSVEAWITSKQKRPGRWKFRASFKY